MKGSSAITGVRQMRASVMMLGSVQRMALTQRLEHRLANRLQRIEHAIAAHGNRLVVGGVARPLVSHILNQILAWMRGVARHFLTRRVVGRPALIERRLE